MKYSYLLARCPIVVALIPAITVGWACMTTPSIAVSQAETVRGPLDVGLFELKEMDMHLHAGMEREVPLDDWIDLAVADGRKVLVLLDHLELYRQSPEEYAAWAEKRGFLQWYPVGPEGHRALMADLAGVNDRDDVITFRGWEIYEGELDTGIEPEPMHMAEVIGWHISPHHGGRAPDGRLLIRRAKQLLELQKQFPVPMILFHPFTMRIENLQRTARDRGMLRAALTVDNYRFFRPGEQRELAELLKNTSVYIEISRGTERYWDDPVTRDALIADIKPLAEAGVQFTVSTDNHGVESAKRPFEPERYCAALGVTPENTNGIVRELLAIRARNSLQRVRTVPRSR